MDRLRQLFARREPYEPVIAQDADNGDADDGSSMRSGKSRTAHRFSKYEYSIFLLLGVAMLWAW